MAVTTSQYKLGTSSLGEALFEALRTRIINGDIEPGEKVTELRVAQEYGVARPTAKSCLERLTSLGLLRRVAHKSAVVPRLTKAEIEDLYFSRSVFESTAVAFLAEKQLVTDEVVRAQEAMRLAEQHGEFTELVQADIRFHWGLVHGFGSERLSRMYEMISGEIHLTMGQYRAHRRTSISNVTSEHQAVIDAIASGDAATARLELERHIRLAKERVIAQLHQDGSAPDQVDADAG
ncbi:MAG TPA: GntR family transcriptional regulator [Actinotalea caeni]|uniref:GntR family transcriptional regulator n=1 Tax=Actinotalea caeni TaxID=1348467 RepID=UPI002B4B5978|nr:GntR family transcriptional regulator [Actinotalea caeni]HLV56929.1 GntR family transcriptional regulator [Actinotalea caeni]